MVHSFKSFRECEDIINQIYKEEFLDIKWKKCPGFQELSNKDY